MNIATTECTFLPGFFQIGYVSNDFYRAQTVIGEQFGIKKYHHMMDMEFDEATRISIAIAYVGDTMIEIITPDGSGEDIYSSHLNPSDDFVIRHHHFGHLYTNEQDWKHIKPLIEKHPVAYRNRTEGFVEAIFTDNRATLGHYLEYVYAMPAGMEELNKAPRNW